MHLALDRDHGGADIVEPGFERRLEDVMAVRTDTPLVATRASVGAIDAEIRCLAPHRPIKLTASARRAHLLLPLHDAVVVTAQGGQERIAAGSAFLAARKEAVSCLGPADARVLLLHFPRVPVQIAAAALIRQPCRLAAVDFAFAIERSSSFQKVLARLTAGLGMRGDMDAALRQRLEADLYAGLAAALAPYSATVLPVARSVQRVIAYVSADPLGDCSEQELARVTGITMAALQRNFRDCYGMPMTRFVQEARLDWVHDRLNGPHESRSISQLATDIRFPSGSAFARAYQRRFGEGPSRTRARAVRG
ncbi:AraC family transcriptional regulator [Sphingobium sp.]|uniref:helix-turn-helix domain-containing protein n=1 Tax=Sphingobium sp. TaxID=1912891 RepID=UPI001A2B8299|nr:AraC family transcriptional regulator [Sphingobium sp.]MBJ7377823.1 helix-turn-helix transcriptional regulator [Sphingobium sp.]